MKVQLKSTDGTENLYPVTAANSVITNDGVDVQTKLDAAEIGIANISSMIGDMDVVLDAIIYGSDSV